MLLSTKGKVAIILNLRSNIYARFPRIQEKKKKGKLDGLHRFQMRVFPGERRGHGAGM